MSTASPESIANPEISYPPELPVSRMRDEILAAIRDHQVVVVAGETGSGKTTQLPKICLELGRSSIAHTQPRRIAARTIAERIAEELGIEVGGLVGFSVRFTDTTSAETRIRLMTDGILLAEIHRDRELRRYDTIVIDEAHERSLNIDFLLGYLKQLLPRRPELKVIITSATIDVEKFAGHFAGPDGAPAPVVEVSGRTFPVEVRYRPLVAGELGETDDEDGEQESRRPPARAQRGDRDLATGVGEALDELARDLPGGDVLVFLSGEAEIRDLEGVLRGRYQHERGGVTEVLPLYGRMSAADQHRVFERSRTPGVRRRIVLATNVAETSLTVPGIRAVVDTGTARISRYSVRSKVQRLPIEAISQASANQRAGRAGRTSAGVAIRLYGETDFGKRPEYTDPEILRTNLAAVILQMISLGLGDIGRFPFLQPPDPRGVTAGLDLLRELGALDGRGELTKVGRDLARLPIDPRFARMLVESRRHGVGHEVLAIVAGLTIQDVRERPAERREQADTMHRRFADPSSDFIALLNLWRYLETKQTELSSSAFRRLCRAEHLNFIRIREWQDLVRQLVRVGRELRLGPAPAPGEGSTAADAIHRSLLAGLLSQIGVRDDRTVKAPHRGAAPERPAGRRGQAEFQGARQVRFVLFPGSSLAKKPPRAVMSAELVETSRLFARTNAAIDPAWAETIAGDLVKRHVGDPRWEEKQGSAVADERVTLFGVPIVEGRRIQYSRVDPLKARDLLIEHAFVQGKWPRETARDRQYDFVRENRRLLRELDDEADRTRTPSPVDEDAVFDFYDRRLPRDVVSVRTFETWWRDAARADPGLLTMRRAELVPETEADGLDPRDFPGEWIQGEQRLRLRYRFDPGSAEDGVTAVVPIALLAQLSPSGFDWQVPGLRIDLVAALIKTLPKTFRRMVVPAADWAGRLVPQLPGGPESDPVPGPFADALAAVVRRAAGANPSPADFDVERVPLHLRIAFDVVDERGARLDRDTDLVALQQRLADRARASVARVTSRPAGRKGVPSDGPAAAPIERDGLTTFDVDELPRVLDVRQSGGVVRAYPSFVDRGDMVSIRLQATPAAQTAAMRAGIGRLLRLATPSPVAYVQSHLSATEKLALAASPYPSTAALFDDCLAAVVDDVQRRATPDGTVWTKAAFEALRDTLSRGVLDELFQVTASAAAVLGLAREIDRAIRELPAVQFLPSLQDARAQLDALVFTGFVSRTGAARLPRVQVHLRGLLHRLERLPQQAARDRVWMADVQTAQTLYAEAGGTLPLASDADDVLVQARWLLEELRLGLFAQHLGTTERASVQRIRKLLAGR